MTPAIDLLKKARAVHQVHSYTHDPKSASYGLEAAEKLQLPPERVFKTLLAASEKGELLVAVVPVAGSLDLKALAQAAGVKKAEMADPQAAQRSTGYLLGGISPLGQKKRLRTFIDNSAQLHESIFVSAGRRGLEVELSAATLAEHTQARFADIGREWLAAGFIAELRRTTRTTGRILWLITFSPLTRALPAAGPSCSAPRACR